VVIVVDARKTSMTTTTPAASSSIDVRAGKKWTDRVLYMAGFSGGPGLPLEFSL
jgi:hypothetical protein